MNEQDQVNVWAVVELMGHGITAGLIRPSDLGGLFRVDVPDSEGDAYRTEYYGPGAVYSIKIVSEEIARVYARPERGIVPYDAPIVPREQYEEALQKSRGAYNHLKHENNVLRERLTVINSLPAPDKEDSQGEDIDMNIF